MALVLYNSAKNVYVIRWSDKQITVPREGFPYFVKDGWISDENAVKLFEKSVNGDN